MSDDICGSKDTTSGEPCKFSPGDSCPWHDTENPPENGRKHTLEKDPDVVDNVADRLAAGDTVAEACAEVPVVSESAYYDWRKQGRDDSSGIFVDFLDETTRARKRAGRQDRAELKERLRETNDTRTWYKLHMKQYGDQYGDEDTDMREEGVRQDIPEEIVSEWYGRNK